MNIAVATFICYVETLDIHNFIDKKINDDKVIPAYHDVPNDSNEIDSVPSKVSPILEDNILHNRLNESN